MEKKERERKTGIGRMLAPSVAVIVLCMVCLFGTSWAWFTVTQKKTVEPIRTASYTGAVTVNDEAVAAAQSEDGAAAYTVSLEANTLYTITITANGDASTGYYIVHFEDQDYYTEQIPKDGSITFSVNSEVGGTMVITPQWGTCTVAGDKIRNGTKLGNGTEAADVTTAEEPEQNVDDVTPSGAASADGSDSPNSTDTTTEIQPNTVNGSSEAAGTEENVVPEAETSGEN